MYEYAGITGYKPDRDGTHLKIFIPDRHLEEAIVKKRIKDCMIWLDDVEVGLDAEMSAEGYKYQNDVAGTVPGTSIGIKETDKGLTPEVSTECYQVRYRLCGETFEI